MLARNLGRIGLGAVALSALIIAWRLAVTHQWVPNRLESVLWFVFAWLFLVPLGALLLVLSGFAYAAEKLRPNLRRSHQALALLVLLVIAIAAAASGTRAMLPVVSQRLGWFRYGIPPAARLSSLGQITRRAGMSFPPTAVLVDGEWLGGPINPYIIAKVRLPRSDVDWFLHRQRSPFVFRDTSYVTSGSRMRRDPEFASAIRVMMARGWHPDLARRAILTDLDWETGTGQPPPNDICWALIELDDPRKADVYVFWAPTSGVVTSL